MLFLQVHTVIKYTLDKLALVGVMVVDPAVQAQALTQSVGEEITRMIEEQKELEQRFEQLISAQHILRTMPNKSKLRNNQVGSRITAAQPRIVPAHSAGTTGSLVSGLVVNSTEKRSGAGSGWQRVECDGETDGLGMVQGSKAAANRMTEDLHS